MTDFCVACGLYTEDEVITEEFRQLHHTLPHGISNTQLWSDWAADSKPYSASSSKGSKLRRLEWRVTHWLLAHSLTGRGKSTGVVNAQDMEYLYSLINVYPINLGVQLAFAMRRQATDKRCGTISCGAFITKLIKGLHLFPDEAPKDELTRSTPINATVFDRWKIEGVTPSGSASGAQQSFDPAAGSSSGLSIEMRLQMMQDYMVESFTALGQKYNIQMPPFPDPSRYSSGQDSHTPQATVNPEFDRSLVIYQPREDAVEDQGTQEIANDEEAEEEADD